MKGEAAPLRVLSYNIHKGFSVGGMSYVLEGIREAIRLDGPDLVFLQEVVGRHDRHQRKIGAWPRQSQFEHLADQVWPHFSYGRNAIYSDGHHGNAILSRYPILSSENIDLSTNRWESRGLLHVVIEIPGRVPRLHAFCSHFGLFEGDRRRQAEILVRRIEAHAPRGEPLVLCGDFNDWRETLSHTLARKASVLEAFLSLEGRHPRSFPAWLPVLRLDRIYYRGIDPIQASVHAGPPWGQLSDHVPLSAAFRLKLPP
jgi:endonuclease/exonuclease/phosphatase family metal-dependent hydrolase